MNYIAGITGFIKIMLLEYYKNISKIGRTYDMLLRLENIQHRLIIAHSRNNLHWECASGFRD